MMALALLAAAAPAAPPPPAPPSVTAESLTKPNVDIWCNVVGVDGRAHAMTFRLNGARGYPAAGKLAYASTLSRFVVVSDETGLLAAGEELPDSPGGFSGEWRNGNLWRFSKTGQELKLVQFFPGQGDTAAVLVQQQKRPMMSAMPDFPYAGTCRSASTPQAPLDAAPNTEDRRK